MRADLLHVVSCIYNPIRWRTRVEHARKAIKHWQDCGVEKITLVECALGQRPHELLDLPGVEHIAVRADTLAWNKESLLNLGLQRSKYQTPFVCWADADIEFRSKSWPVDTVHALQQYAVVQPWSDAVDLGPSGEPMMIKGFHVQTSFAKVWHELGDIKAQQNVGHHHHHYSHGWRYPHPGYVWAIRRDVLNNIGGFIEASGLGSGDHQMAMSFVGRIDNSIHGRTNKNYQAMIRGWGERAYKFVQGNLGYCQGTIEHQFHGDKNGPHGRKYQERWDILIDEDFDPLTDVRKNLDGVMELAGNKPRLRHRFDQYFRQRDEDANVRRDDHIT